MSPAALFSSLRSRFAFPRRAWILTAPLAPGALVTLALGTLATLGVLLVLAPLAPLASGQQKTPPAKKPRAAALSQAKKVQADWNQVTGSLLDEYFFRHPDEAFQRSWPEAKDLDLGSFGARAEIRWRDALRDARASLERMQSEEVPAMAQAQLDAFEDWLAAETLVLGSQRLSTCDPSGYVQRATRVLQAVSEAVWLPKDQRLAKIAVLLIELDAYFDDARTSLISPSASWIDLALRDLDDLDDLVKELLKGLPAKPKASLASARKKAPDPDPLAAIDEFRRWLLEARARAGRVPPRLDADEWSRLAQLVSGTDLELGEIKARCLRDLARVDPLARRTAPLALLKSADPESIAQHAWSASAHALAIGQAARLLRFPVYPKSVEFAIEESPRTRAEPVWLRMGTTGVIRAFIELPSRTWSPHMTSTRYESLQPRQQAALGIRHGMAGEAMFAHIARSNRRPLAAFLCNRALYEGIGLYALDWLPEVDWVDNPFRADDELLREFELMRAYEGARLLAALEQHAEGLSLEEAVAGFQRRTAVDEDTARAEALQAQRDPLHGIGYLGLLELQTLERGLSMLAKNERKGLALTLLSTSYHPDLRPSDLVPVVRASLSQKKKR